MTFQDRFSQPREGHELVALERESGVSWCLRCGALCFDPRPGVRDKTLREAPGQAGRSLSTEAAPPCLLSTDAGAHNVAGDARLMLRALTHGWRCEPVLMHTKDRAQAWRWTREGPLGGDAWSVRGAWDDGPAVDDTVRELLLTTSETVVPSSRRP